MRARKAARGGRGRGQVRGARPPSPHARSFTTGTVEVVGSWLGDLEDGARLRKHAPALVGALDIERIDDLLGFEEEGDLGEVDEWRKILPFAPARRKLRAAVLAFSEADLRDAAKKTAPRARCLGALRAAMPSEDELPSSIDVWEMRRCRCGEILHFSL